MDPEKSGEILWQYRAGQGSALGGIEWGAATDGEHAYFAVSDILTKQPGGLHAVNLETGTRAWSRLHRRQAAARGRGATARSPPL